MKKVFLFAGTVIALVLAVSYLTSAINYFILMEFANNSSDVISYAILYLIFAIAIFAAGGIAFAITLKSFKKETSLLAPAILLAVCAAIVLFGHQTVYGVMVVKSVKSYQEQINNPMYVFDEQIINLYKAQIKTTVISYAISFVEGLTLTALAVLSFINFDKKKEANPQIEEAEY